MFQPSQRKVLLLNLHPMAKAYSFGAPPSQYFISHTVTSRWWTRPEKSFPAIRALHRSDSQVELSSSKSSNIGKTKTQLVPVSAKHPPSIIQTIYAAQWSSVFSACRQRLSLEGVRSFARKLPANMAVGYSMVKNSREYELAQKTVTTLWRLSVSAVRSAFFWLCVFLESREFFYLQYYGLLGLEYAIVWLRYGLRFSFQLLRTMLSKK